MTEEDTLALSGRLVALPETRQLDVLAGLLERRGARVLRCPLVAILDAPDQGAVRAWLDRFLADQALHDLVVLTGEGMRRLISASERAGLREAFAQRLGQVRKITRGPKPGGVFHDLGLTSDVVARVPTTAGVIAALEDLQFDTDRIAVQLYGSEPNEQLQSYLRRRGLEPVTVSPYMYAHSSDEQRVLDLIERLARHEVDAIAFTSQTQIERLFAVARAQAREAALRDGLAACAVAAVGPVVADYLTGAGLRVDIMPKERFFMRPLADALAARLPACKG
ncbi:MAG: uroporphyrinogen-III synthase [Gammaproteobacteria bacterium]|nr:uroporphyrinogen-III synthase [Gammaproteobacteria bacterium]